MPYPQSALKGKRTGNGTAGLTCSAWSHGMRIAKTRARQASVQTNGYRYGLSTCRDHYEGGTVGADPELCEPPTGSRPHLVDETVNPPLYSALKLDPSHPYLAERGLWPRPSRPLVSLLLRQGAMAGRIAILIHDETGTLVAYAGRWPGDDGWRRARTSTSSRALRRRMSSTSTVFDTDHLVVVEGYFSVLRLHELGIAAVVLMGRSLSPEQEELLARHRCGVICGG